MPASVRENPDRNPDSASKTRVMPKRAAEVGRHWPGARMSGPVGVARGGNGDFAAGMARSIGAKLNNNGVKLNSNGAKLNSIGAKLNSNGAKLNSTGVQLNSIGAKLNSFGAKLHRFGALSG
ncbi:MAG: hypothetical protein ACK5Q8_00780 [Phycisphaerales bacterium]